MNAPQQVIEDARRRYGGTDSDDIEVWQENWQSVMLFLAVSTQWLFAPSGKPSGISYQSVESIMNTRGIRKHRRCSLMSDVRFMEEIALGVFRERE